jgi:cell division protein FtsL
MDKKIKKIEKKISKDSKGEEKELKSLARDDKKRDKMCDMGKKEMMKHKKK